MYQNWKVCSDCAFQIAISFAIPLLGDITSLAYNLGYSLKRVICKIRIYRNNHFRQFYTAFERLTSDTRHALGDGYAHKIFTARECTLADFFHTHRNSMTARFSQPENDAFWIFVTPSRMIMLVRLVQLQNELVPIFVTPSGMVMLARLVQPENAFFPILVTPLGMLRLARLLQSSNALSRYSSRYREW